MRRLILFYNILSNGKPDYLFKLIPDKVYSSTRNNKIPVIQCRTNIFSNSFFPYTINEWNRLNDDIKLSKSSLSFRNKILKFIRPSPRSVYGVSDFEGLRLLTRLRVGLSHLNAHRFSHNFRDCVNPLCFCNNDEENTEHFILHCHQYKQIRATLFEKVLIACNNFQSLSYQSKTSLLLYGDSSLTDLKNKTIIEATICFIKDSNRFSGPLY